MSYSDERPQGPAYYLTPKDLTIHATDDGGANLLFFMKPENFPPHKFHYDEIEGMHTMRFQTLHDAQIALSLLSIVRRDSY